VSLLASASAVAASPRFVGSFGRTRRSMRVFEREARAYRQFWTAFVTGIVEPLLFLGSIGIGVGKLVGDVPGPSGAPVSYREFVAPALLATSAMTGSLLDSTFNFFGKFKYMKTFDGMLATPLSPMDVARGELTWSLSRGAFYSATFLAAMTAFGLVASWWALLAVPVALLIGFAFSGVGLACTTYMRSFLDFDMVFVAMMPLFLFSATFFPLERYPDSVATIVQWTPLYQGVELCRSLILGHVHVGLLWNVVYLAAMGWLGLRHAAKRLGKLLQP
jgi:lipooligosaccharide transport system permease protein